MTLESKSSGTDPGLFETILGDGRPLLVLTGASLMFSGGFALFLSAGRQFLPQDLAFLGMTPAELCRLNGCRVLDFMIHDRVAFGGALIAIGSLFVWLAIFPLGEGEDWAWWIFILSGAIGFGSFLAYLGFGYLDTWHGVGTLLLLPVFALGLVRSRRLVAGVGPGVMLRPRAGPPWASQSGLGRGLMLVAAAGMTLGGFTILWVGVTRVFVSQDLGFTGTTRMALDALNPRIVPLLAHDRAGFGGAVCTTGLTAFFKPRAVVRQEGHDAWVERIQRHPSGPGEPQVLRHKDTSHPDPQDGEAPEGHAGCCDQHEPTPQPGLRCPGRPCARAKHDARTDSGDEATRSHKTEGEHGKEQQGPDSVPGVQVSEPEVGEEAAEPDCAAQDEDPPGPVLTFAKREDCEPDEERPDSDEGAAEGHTVVDHEVQHPASVQPAQLGRCHPKESEILR